ncbi:phospholipid carrier-dependent glycosyltransferase [Aeromicrobium camelliae]|uniref:Polyprenol-phosphate-mannose--protein mannosyltransferase n=1 Tax=Aeromicrobium camelliae TaxID=1538144 RepID=A0A3N6WRK7_9ACTN|nr:phospholipid carrier-dependent glycosyltransferase [Aeromicrobium camelliae]RQN10089.1 phospholipid carrier-dependent glycosyltransferase [Aeromicrobium camelliae]
MLSRVSWRAWSWIVPVAVTLLAFAVRVVRLSAPERLAFDETYYAKDAWSLLQHGYVLDFIDGADDRIAAGDVSGLFAAEPSWIVHPDGGKWLIALGEALFGLTPVGWRISAAVAGALTVLVLARLLIRLTGAIWVGALGGLLLALDGVHFVMSRLALLDIFLTLWLVCAVACLVADRDWLERRLAVENRWRGWRPWQLAAGLAFGMAAATKWSGLYVLAAFGLTVVVWEVAARRRWARAQGAAPAPWWNGVLRAGLPSFARLVLVAGAVYLISWTGWFLHREEYERRFGHGYGDYAAWGHLAEPTGGPIGGVVDALRSWWQFHLMTWDFHTGDYLADKTHPYASHPIGWLLPWRPVAVDTNTDVPAQQCGAPSDSSCISEVLILGNPAVWWIGTLAIVAVLGVVLRRRQWRLSIPLVGLAATWLPWFATADRPIFSFYSVAMVPFLVIAVGLAANGVHRRLADQGRGAWSLTAICAYALVVAGLFVYFYPIWTDVLLPYDSWRQRMWLGTWI